LNVRSDRAYATAHKLAAKLNTTAAAVVEAALEHYAAAVMPEVSAEDMAETYALLRRLAAEGSKKAPPGASSDHGYLYDDHGLPV
jgi:hypothetical protein